MRFREFPLLVAQLVSGREEIQTQDLDSEAKALPATPDCSQCGFLSGFFTVVFPLKAFENHSRCCRGPCIHTPWPPGRSPADSSQTLSWLCGLLAWGILWPPDSCKRMNAPERSSTKEGWELEEPYPRFLTSQKHATQSVRVYCETEPRSPTEVASSSAHLLLVSCPSPS